MSFPSESLSSADKEGVSGASVLETVDLEHCWNFEARALAFLALCEGNILSSLVEEFCATAEKRVAIGEFRAAGELKKN